MVHLLEKSLRNLKFHKEPDTSVLSVVNIPSEELLLESGNVWLVRNRLQEEHGN